MNDDIARALLELVEVLTKAADALADDPERTADGLVLLIAAIEAAVENYGNNQYEDNDRQIARSLIDLAATEMAGLVLVAGTTTLLAPGAGVVAIAVATVGAGELISQWLDTNRISFFPSVQDASSATHGVTLYGYAPLGDTLTSSTHDDRVFGFSGNDYIVNSGGSDAVFGGLGQDTLDYSAMAFASTGGIILDASAGDGSFVVHHHSDSDLVTEVEHIIGTVGADAFVLGNYGANIAGGEHIESVQAGGGDDIALLLNEGGAGPRRVAIDGGSGLDTVVIADDGFNTEIDFNAGTVRYQGGVNAQFSIAGFEAAQGGDGSDVMLGGDGSEYLLGNGGADRLFGGGADDFIFFDAADGANVYGGAGRDVAVALGSEGVTVDMAAQGLECVIGCEGADTITVAEADQPVFAAGSGGADHFILDNFDAHGPRILWGGAGADVFEFQNGGQVSLAVVSIDGLTEEAFSRLTLADLGLGGIDVSLLSAIIINPDATDRFYSDDLLLGTSSVDPSEWSQIGDDPDFLAHLVPGYASPVSFGVRTSDALGGSHAIQAVFDNEVRAHHQTTFYYNFFDITVWSNGDYKVVETENYVEHWINDVEEAIDDALMSAELEFAQFDEYGYDWATSEYWTVQERSDLPKGPFLVVGGAFAGDTLADNGDLTGSLPDDPGSSPFDWLLAA